MAASTKLSTSTSSSRIEGGERSRRAVRRYWLASLFCAIAALAALPARAHTDGLSEASAASGLAVAASVSAPVELVSAAGALTLASVEVAADGTVWVLKRASDGATIAVKWASNAAGVASVAVGTAITVTAVSAGWVLSAAGQVLALIPNELGKALMHHERVIK